MGQAEATECESLSKRRKNKKWGGEVEEEENYPRSSKYHHPKANSIEWLGNLKNTSSSSSHIYTSETRGQTSSLCPNKPSAHACYILRTIVLFNSQVPPLPRSLCAQKNFFKTLFLSMLLSASATRMSTALFCRYVVWPLFLSHINSSNTGIIES